MFVSAVLASTGSILDPIAKPVAYVLAACYSLVPNYAVAILMLSILWMLLISPLTLKTTRSMLAMSKLTPEINKLKDQHKNDRAALSQATMDLYKEHNVSPFGACLPSLLPMPIFLALFRVIDGLSRKVKGVPEPKYLSAGTRMYKDIAHAGGNVKAFGVNLSSSALSHHASFWAALPYFILLLVMMGTQYYQTVQTMARNPAAQQNSQARIMKFLPLFFGLICIRFPAGVVLYYAMSNICRVVQQTLMYRFDPKVKALVALEIDEVEAKTREIDAREGPAGRRSGGSAGSGGPSPGTPASPRGPRGLGSGGAGADKPPSRGRFRDLLADASQQAQARQEDRPAKGVTPPKNRPTPARDAAKRASAAQQAAAQKSTGTPAKAQKAATTARPAAGGRSVTARAGGASQKSAPSSGAASGTGAAKRDPETAPAPGVRRGLFANRAAATSGSGPTDNGGSADADAKAASDAQMAADAKAPAREARSSRRPGRAATPPAPAPDWSTSDAAEGPDTGPSDAAAGTNGHDTEPAAKTASPAAGRTGASARGGQVPRTPNRKRRGK